MASFAKITHTGVINPLHQPLHQPKARFRRGITEPLVQSSHWKPLAFCQRVQAG